MTSDVKNAGKRKVLGSKAMKVVRGGGGRYGGGGATVRGAVPAGAASPKPRREGSFGGGGVHG